MSFKIGTVQLPRQVYLAGDKGTGDGDTTGLGTGAAATCT